MTSDTRRSSPSGRPNSRGGALAEPLDQPVDDGGQPIDRDLESPVPGRQPVVHGTDAGQARVQHGQGVAELRVVVTGRREPHRAGHQLLVRERVAGEPGGVRLQRADLGGQPVSPFGVLHLEGDAFAGARARPRAAGAGARSCSMSTRALRSAGPK